MSEQEPFKQWVVIELLGHRKLSGHASEAIIAGAKFIQLDIFPGQSVIPLATQFYSPSSVYCITPTTEYLARQHATRYQPEPLTRWELPAVVESESDDSEDFEIDDEEIPL